MQDLFFKALSLLLSLTLVCCSQDELLPINVNTQSLIAFDHVGEDVWDHEIYVLNPITKEIQQLTDNSFIDEQPSWSPNGDKIAYVSRRTTGVAKGDFMSNPLELVIADLQSLEVQPVRKWIDLCADSLARIFEAKGIKIYRNSSYYGGQINPQWISNSKIGLQAHFPFGYLAYYPVLYNIYQKDIALFFDPEIEFNFNLKDIVWVDSSGFYAVQNPKANPITDDPKYPLTLIFYDVKEGTMDTLFQDMKRFSGLSFHAPTNQLFFISDDTREPKPDDFIFAYHLDSGEKERIARGSDVTVSPDGMFIAYTRPVGKKVHAIFKMNLATRIEEKLIEMPGYIGTLEWSPSLLPRN